ncbi:NADH-quinone oxidoreductase subunit C [Streptomyces sp. NPDC051014]|uniref:NADH-quinone oxidoreductase subunit C n=1 Tax=Streptomyces sp. NPDC051014 TaxID=3155751 RepID=UPI0033EF747D
MTAPAGWLPAPVDELFGPDATAEESYEVLTVDVPPSSWLTALDTARTALGCTFFDWMSAVDEPGTGFRVSAHLVALAPVRRLLLRTTVPHSAAELPSAVGVYAGARWHERETHEMFGVRFSGHPGLDHLLLPETFEGHPLRKDFVLAARVAKAWPGAKEPGESDHAGPRRRQMLPPGVPDPNDWGPLKGQLPPAPARPARAAAGRPAGDRPARAAGDRPVRRSRTAAEGSAGRTTDETPPTAATPTPTPAPEPTPTGTEPTTTPRRGRSASEGSASQRTVPGEQAPPAATPRRGRSASEGSASQRAVSAAGESAAGENVTGDQTAAGGSAAGGEAAEAAKPTAAAPRGPRRARTASGGSASQRAQDTAPASDPATPARPATPRSPDAPWHHARPAFDEPGPEEQRPDTATEATEPTTPSGSTEPTTPSGSTEPTTPSGSTEPTGPTGSEPVSPAPPAVPEEGEASDASEGARSESARSDADDSDAPPGPGAAPEERPDQPTPREDRPGGPQ